MKFEVDLSEVLRDEYGNGESLQESVRRQVVEKLTAQVSEGISAQIKAEVARVLSEELQAAVKEKMPSLLNELMDAEYNIVNNWGEVTKEKTTFRKELVKAITGQMVYKKQSSSYDNNNFTKAIDAVIAENVRAMQKDFDAKVIELFQKEAFTYAMNKMAEKLQIKLAPADYQTNKTQPSLSV